MEAVKEISHAESQGAAWSTAEWNTAANAMSTHVKNMNILMILIPLSHIATEGLTWRKSGRGLQHRADGKDKDIEYPAVQL